MKASQTYEIREQLQIEYHQIAHIWLDIIENQYIIIIPGAIIH